MALDAGVLRVTLHYAKDLKDCDWFGRQDPYVRVRIGNQERRSKVCKDGGRNPVWDETFEFSVINENNLELIIMDEDTLKRDDLIGSCTISLAKAREFGKDVVQAPVSSGKKAHKQKGFVQVSLIFTSNSTLRPSSSFPAAPPQAYGYPAPPPSPYGYAYPPPQAPPPPAPAYAPPPPPYYQAPSYHYSPSFAPGAPAAPAPPPPAPAPAPPAWQAPPAYATASAPPSYYPPLPVPPGQAPAHPPYYGSAPSYRS